ncbi:MAG: ABC transporter substrate-binding protein [Gammaproteobacteria bacterium]|nr:ABC transporter substrate-binding protein [Gammaproteobacteria bacterium]MCI0590613.1 ABC transporter substrate-binding protein [Gammaproteobacteria bacterium]
MVLRSHILLPLSLLLVAIVGGCADPRTENIRFGMAAAPVTLDPRFATDAASYRINRLLYRRLVDFNAAEQPVPALATWQRLSPAHYRFTLGGDARVFHDGRRLTSIDVKGTYDSVLEPATGSPHRGSLTVIERIEVLDNDTLDFYLRKPDPLFPGRLTIGILPHQLITSNHPFHQLPLGSGPLRFVEWPAQDKLILLRVNDGLTLELVVVLDPTVRVLKLLRGEIDLIQGDLPQELVAWLDHKPEVVVQRSRGSTFTYLGFNLDDPVVGNIDIRRAIAYALDRESIIAYVMGHAARKANALLPPDHWAGYPHLPGYPYAPDRARALIRQAGYDMERPVEITYKTSNHPFRVRLATIIQHQLQQVGIHVELKSYDWGTFYGDIKAGRFQMYSLSWVGLQLPDIFRYVFHSTSVPPQGANRGRFINAQADRLIEAAENAVHLSALAERYRVLQAYLLEELPYVPLWYEDNVLVRRRDAVGYTLAPDGNYDGLSRVRRIPSMLFEQ